ncbi:MAG: hypothetical protein ACP5M4_01660 [Acidobacteriaceae bacterium]
MPKSKLRQIFRPWLWCAAAIAAFAIFVPVAVFGSAFAVLVYLYLFLPFGLSAGLMVGLVLAKRQAVSILAATVMFCAVTWLLFQNADAVKDTARWHLYGSSYQRRVLAAPAQTGQLKHVVWDGWELGGMDTTVYLVYDPENSLATAARKHTSGKFAGIPCPVPSVRRLASEWYAVEFFTGERWNRCGAKAVPNAKTHQ